MDGRIFRNGRTRRLGFTLVELLVVIAIIGVAGCALADASKPNFLFVLTDDQRYDAMGCADNPHIRTPSLDSLAARGMRFRNAFVTLSICSPSRAACLTGNYGSVNGVTRLDEGLAPGQTTFAQHLRQHGHRTRLIGKWHLSTRPSDCGFDADGLHSKAVAPARGQKEPNPPLEHGGEDGKAAQAIAFMREAAKKEQPFVLWLCTNVPHMPWRPRQETLDRYDEAKLPAPASYTDDLSGKPAYLKNNRHRKNGQAMGYATAAGIHKQERQYYAAITDMDTSMGKVLAELDHLGLRDNTYVFWMGDNGWMLGEHGFSSKVLAYEPSIRVPFVVAGPGIKPGSVDDHLVLNIDWAPTMYELAGAPAVKTHGRSLVPLLRGQKVDWRIEFLYEAPQSELDSRPLYAVRTERWKYIHTLPARDVPGGFEELYDLSKDPAELQNVVADPSFAEIKRQLQQDLERLRRKIAGK